MRTTCKPCKGSGVFTPSGDYTDSNAPPGEAQRICFDCYGTGERIVPEVANEAIRLPVEPMPFARHQSLDGRVS